MVFDNWIAILTLIITIANIFIAGVIVPLYLNNKITSTQKQIVELQSDLNRKTQTATLEIETGSGGGKGGFSIRNTGIATAINVRIVVRMEKIYGAWKEKIFGVESFLFFPRFSAIKYTSERTYIAKKGDDIQNTNTIIFAIEKLSPNSEIGFDFSLDPKFLNNKIFIEGKSNLYFPANAEYLPIEGKYRHEIRKYLEKNNIIARFKISATSDNCEFVKRDKSSFFIPAFVSGETKLSISDEIARNKNRPALVITYSASYYYPEGHKEFDTISDSLFYSYTDEEAHVTNYDPDEIIEG